MARLNEITFMASGAVARADWFSGSNQRHGSTTEQLTYLIIALSACRFEREVSFATVFYKSLNPPPYPLAASWRGDSDHNFAVRSTFHAYPSTIVSAHQSGMDIHPRVRGTEGSANRLLAQRPPGQFIPAEPRNRLRASVKKLAMAMTNSDAALPNGQQRIVTNALNAFKTSKNCRVSADLQREARSSPLPAPA